MDAYGVEESGGESSFDEHSTFGWICHGEETFASLWLKFEKSLSLSYVNFVVSFIGVKYITSPEEVKTALLTK